MRVWSIRSFLSQINHYNPSSSFVRVPRLSCLSVLSVCPVLSCPVLSCLSVLSVCLSCPVLSCLSVCLFVCPVLSCPVCLSVCLSCLSVWQAITILNNDNPDWWHGRIVKKAGRSNLQFRNQYYQSELRMKSVTVTKERNMNVTNELSNS
jgi:hypothetical protein